MPEPSGGQPASEPVGIAEQATGRLLALAIAVLQAEGWPVTSSGEASTRYSAFAGGGAPLGVLVHAREAEGQLLVYSFWPGTVPAGTAPLVAELVGRLNCGMPFGNFELDLETGVLSFKTSLCAEAGFEPTAALIRPLFYGNVFAMSHYAEAISAVAGGARSPGEALALLEPARTTVQPPPGPVVSPAQR